MSDLRVGFVSYTDPGQEARMASMPYRMARALEPRVGQLLTFSPEGGTGMRSVRRPITRWPVVGRPARYLAWRFLTFDGSLRTFEHRIPKHTYRRTVRRAARLSRNLADEINRHELDALVGCIVTWPLFRNPTALPYVFYTDATTTMVNATFPRFSDRCWGFKQACAEVEDAVYAGASAVGFPADRVLESALAHHALPPGRGHVIPMGANVQPARPLADVSGLTLPTRENLRLLIVASDAVRKRVDFALDVVETLRRRGWGAVLDIIGRSTPRADAAPYANYLGHVRLSQAEDVERLQAAYANGHVFILPSLGEGAAISPAEAAHFGRPSIVSDVAGLPTVVQEGVTGRVMPMDTEPEDYADAIEAMVADSGTYLQFALAALERAQRVFTWEAWAESIAGLLRRAADDRRGERAP